MPELPEVETIKNGLKEFCLDTKIIGSTIYNYKLRYPISSDLSNLILQKTIIDIKRRAKYLILELNKGILLFHLGMSGKLDITQQLSKQRHVHISLQLANGLFINFHDPRKFGAVIWVDDYLEDHFLIKNLGVEPFSKEFHHKYLHERCQKRKISIKQLLMDSKTIVGIGNIYASEILFCSNIRPDRTANTISLKEAAKLYESILKVLTEAIKAGGTTIKDFRNAKGELGYFAQSLSVYGRIGQNCIKCNEVILKIVQNKRSTYYCSKCQK